MRKILPALVLLCLPSFLAVAQPAPDVPPAAQVMELRLLALSRAYVRPLAETVARLNTVPGITDAQAVSYADDVLTLKCTTSLSHEAIASALGLRLLRAEGLALTLAPSEDIRSRRAEARAVVGMIGRKVADSIKRDSNGERTGLEFGARDGIEARVQALGLDPAILKGSFYQPADYHLETPGEGSGDGYRIWAGDKWEGMYVANTDSSNKALVDYDPASRFVGMIVPMGWGYQEPAWVDGEGIMMASVGERSDTNWSGELAVVGGSKLITEIMQAAVAWRIRNSTSKLEAAPNGRGYTLMNELPGGDDIEYWGYEHYEISDLLLTWRADDEGNLVARVRAHTEASPWYLDAEVNTGPVLKRYAEMDRKTRREVNRADLGNDLVWLHGPETDAAVLRARRDEARNALNSLSDALAATMKAKPDTKLEALCGTLDNAELAAALGFKADALAYYKPAEFTIRRQMLGDVEIAVGTPAKGGRRWIVMNPASGEVIRRFQ